MPWVWVWVCRWDVVQMISLLYVSTMTPLRACFNVEVRLRTFSMRMCMRPCA